MCTARAEKHQSLVSQGQLVEAGDVGPALGGEANAQGDSEVIHRHVCAGGHNHSRSDKEV